MKIVLPPQPTPGVIAALQATAGQPETPTNQYLAATAPPQVVGQYGPVRQLPDSFVTSLVSQQAVLASNLNPSQRIQYGILDSTSGVTFGQLAQPGQSLKPGSGEFLQQLVAQNPGLPFNFTAQPTLMTGNAGVSDAASLLSNTGAQVGAINNSIVSATTALTESRVITGAESPTQVSGVIMAASLTSPTGVTEVLQNPQTVASVVGSPDSIIGSAITAGTFAGGLADRVSSGLNGVASSVSGLAGGAIDSLSSGLSGAVAGLSGGISTVFATGTGVLQGAFALAEQSFGTLKAGVPNLLGGLPQNVDLQPSKTVTQVNLYDIAVDDLLAAEEELSIARIDYSAEASPENLSKLRAAQAKVAAAKQKVSRASENILNGSPQRAAGIGAISTQDISALGNAAASGLLNNPNQGNTGVNSLPGGLGAFANIVGSAATSVLGRIGGAAASVGALVPGALATLTNPGALVGGLVSGLSSRLGGVGGNIVGGLAGITGLLGGGAASAVANGVSAATGGLLSNISSALGSLGNAPGQTKVATLATNTYAKQSAVISATLDSAMDPKVPPPSFEVVPPEYTPDEYQAAQSSAQVVIKELSAQRRVAQFNLAQLNAKFVETQNIDLLIDIELAQQEVEKIDIRLAAAQTNYSRIVAGII